MVVIKILTLVMIFTSSTYLGILISKKYLNRVNELKEMKIALNILNTKIKFTYEPLPQAFKEISNQTKQNISNIFNLASNKMKNGIKAENAWNEALDEVNTNLKKEDIDAIKNLSNLLGKVDIEGQINEINLVENFIDKQIESAEEEKKKYMKMYRTLGATIGLAVVIILI